MFSPTKENTCSVSISTTLHIKWAYSVCPNAPTFSLRLTCIQWDFRFVGFNSLMKRNQGDFFKSFYWYFQFVERTRNLEVESFYLKENLFFFLGENVFSAILEAGRRGNARRARILFMTDGPISWQICVCVRLRVWDEPLSPGLPFTWWPMRI